MTIDENASVYVLYAGKDPKVKKVVEEIKIMLEEKGIEGFDYQARDVADKPDREKNMILWMAYIKLLEMVELLLCI